MSYVMDAGKIVAYFRGEDVNSPLLIPLNASNTVFMLNLISQWNVRKRQNKNNGQTALMFLFLFPFFSVRFLDLFSSLINFVVHIFCTPYFRGQIDFEIRKQMDYIDLDPFLSFFLIESKDKSYLNTNKLLFMNRKSDCCLYLFKKRRKNELFIMIYLFAIEKDENKKKHIFN